jgi:hypothetical protein
MGFHAPCFSLDSAIVLIDMKGTVGVACPRVEIKESGSGEGDRDMHKVPQCLSPRWNWDPPHPLSRKRVCSPFRNQRGVNTRLRGREWGSPNSDDWRESLVLCLLCGEMFLPMLAGEQVHGGQCIECGKGK